MRTTRRLALRKATLTELGTEELTAVNGAQPDALVPTGLRICQTLLQPCPSMSGCAR